MTYFVDTDRSVDQQQSVCSFGLVAFCSQIGVVDQVRNMLQEASERLKDVMFNNMNSCTQYKCAGRWHNSLWANRVTQVKEHKCAGNHV